MPKQTSKILNTQVLTTNAGPCRDKLMQAFCLKSDYGNRVTLTSEDGHELELQVMGLEYADGKRGAAFNITGCALEPQGTVTTRNWRSFKAYFNTENRRGTFQFTD